MAGSLSLVCMAPAGVAVAIGMISKNGFYSLVSGASLFLASLPVHQIILWGLSMGLDFLLHGGLGIIALFFFFFF